MLCPVQIVALFEEIKKNGLTDTLSEQLENINDKIRTEAKKTNGRIIAVTVDPETLEVSFEGKKAKFGLFFVKEQGFCRLYQVRCGKCNSSLFSFVEESD